MEAVSVMDTLEQEIIDRPVVNPWLRSPSREQVRFALDLCRSELPYAERQGWIDEFPQMDSQEMSALIDRLKSLRAARFARLRGRRRRR
jgi:hypothetical protein